MSEEQQPDLIAQMDQAEKGSQELARPLLAFYTALRNAGMHEVTIHQLTMKYADVIFKLRGSASG